MVSSLFRSAALALVTLAATSATVATSSIADASPPAVEVKLKDITQALVPQELLKGDREFGGNGPLVECTVTLDVTADKKHIRAEIDFTATETKPDHTKVHDFWNPIVYTAPSGKTIEEIVTPVTSTISFVSKPAGFQLFAPAQDYIKMLEQMQKVAEALLKFGVPGAPGPHTAAEQQMKQLSDKVIAGTAYLTDQGNHVYLKRPASGPVQVIGIVGDTGGPDVSTDADGKDDTRITGIKFRPIKVRLK